MSISADLKYVNKVIAMDCIAGMRQLPPAIADLVIADPPYGLSEKGKNMSAKGKNWKIVNEKWDTMTKDEFHSMAVAFISEAKRLMKPDATIWVYGTYHRIGVVKDVLDELEFDVLNEVIWFKRNAFPNLSADRFAASHENILWARVKGSGMSHKFNYDLIKDMSFPEDSFKERGKQMRSVWDIPINKGRNELEFGSHPTQKPLRICKRIILSCSNQDDIVLVPFCGSGSECVASYQLRRRFISFETNADYRSLAIRRLKHERQQGMQTSIDEFARLVP